MINFILQSSQASNWSTDYGKEVSLENVNTALSLLSNGKFSPVKHKVRKEIDCLQPSSKRGLKRKATIAVEALLDCIAPGQGTKLLELIKGDKCVPDVPESELKNTIIKLYNNSNEYLIKRQLLSMLAKDHTKKQLLEMIPGLSTYSIDQARLHASMHGEGKLNMDIKTDFRISYIFIY